MSSAYNFDELMDKTPNFVMSYYQELIRIRLEDYKMLATLNQFPAKEFDKITMNMKGDSDDKIASLQELGKFGIGEKE